MEYLTLLAFHYLFQKEFLRYIHVYHPVSQPPSHFTPTGVKTLIHCEFDITALFVQLRSQVLFIEEIIKKK